VQGHAADPEWILEALVRTSTIPVERNAKATDAEFSSGSMRGHKEKKTGEPRAQEMGGNYTAPTAI
jgi:hypothetical protein